MTHFLLVGNPNCGKTTLFNALTGANQRVGNWPGVTVEKKTGSCKVKGKMMQVTDLPGIYSLSITNYSGSLDEQIAAKAIVNLPADFIVNVIDACHLERHLYLTSQILELGKPVIIVLNMLDIAEQRGININSTELAKWLNCPVIPLQAHQGIGMAALTEALTSQKNKALPLKLPLPAAITESLAGLEVELVNAGKDRLLVPYFAHRIMEGDTQLYHELLAKRPGKDDFGTSDRDIIIADARYQKIHEIVKKVQQKRSDASEHFTAKVDRIILHRFFALPIFFAVMYFMFLFAINVGGVFQDFFDISTDTIFVQGTAWLLQQFPTPEWLIALLANGVGKGINTTLTFIPVIAAMFFFLSLLEASGYMARAAFVVDKVMRAMGLPGKSFVPMIVGFGCNVPAIMAARTLDSERDRVLTVLMSPFMSCSARLAIYAVFVAAFFPHGGQNVVFSLYLIGILMAVLTGFILRKTTLRENASPLILELPAYHKPSLKRLLRETALRLRYFVYRAGRLIVPICILLGALNTLTIHGGIHTDEASTQSVLSWLGQWLTPVFAPMGISEDNWPATVGLLTGMLAKEVVVGTLNSLYAQIGHIDQLTIVNFDFWGSMQSALWSVPRNFAHLGHAIVNPILASSPDSVLSHSVYGIMEQRFAGQAAAYAYLLFVLLYIPCVSTMAVIRQETNSKFMWFSICWSLILAYSTAVLFYQVATVSDHPQQSFTWILLIVSGGALLFNILRHKTLDYGDSYVITNP